MPNRQDIDWSRELFLYCVAVEWFLYGIHAVLFCFCIRTLRQSRVRHRLALFVAISVIFAFCTIHWILQLVNAGELMTVLEKMAHVKGIKVNFKALMNKFNKINIAMGALYVTSNLIADGIFIYRCYCIWGYRRRIIAVPIILLVATGGLGYASVIACGLEGFSEFLFINWLFPLEVIFSVMTNVLLMALTAGRIWWIARGARAVMGPTVVKQYRTVAAMILESGAVYCIPGLLYLIFLGIRPSSTQVIFAALAQVVGIAPTIIVVRVGLGNSVDNVDSFREGRTPIQGSVVDIRAEDLEPNLEYWGGKMESEMV
ncbi:hypothetical protein DFH06DRAFT_274518 [Mycena polygramma]|nr:hypothetical protein DFH06DRAFT_274518 [Mycena polygramma]